MLHPGGASHSTPDGHPILRPVCRIGHMLRQASLDDCKEMSLVNQFGVDDADADKVLGYDNNDNDDDGYQPEEDEPSDDGGNGDAEDEDQDRQQQNYGDFQKWVRVTVPKRAEGNHCTGGLKMQQAIVKAWEEFVQHALHKGEIKDSQLKKLFFGALWICKEQVAKTPSLAHKCPATSVIVLDAIKNRMDEAIDGLVPSKDAPDIITNTFIAEVTQEQLDAIALGLPS
ncbi:hypothetical protein L208DRAFT_1383142 [Tricholoma matsutake]|nr:hypothetical protein L208DRAFT_1383142 [Tricholoma matsutake 945]